MSSEWGSSATRLKSYEGAPEIIVANAQMSRLLQFAERAAASPAKVLITGESGTGKDLIARYVHVHSNRRNAQYVAVNCAGVTESLLESELFGHVKGSFTGALRDKVGTLQRAHRGTLFLDEVGEMSLRMQAMLLRFLETGEIQAVGEDRGGKTIADVRVIAATNRNLSDMVSAGLFREDLLYRLRVIHLHVPPLRDRTDEIRPLAEAFVARFGPAVVFSDEVWNALAAHRWPGNVRELQNVIEQLVSMALTGVPVELDQVPQTVRPSATPTLPGRERRRQIADDLFQALVSGEHSLWEHVHPLFLNRDITRHDIREMVRRGLETTRGNYRGLLELFRMPVEDYKRFMNFLTTHGCRPDFREFRSPSTTVSTALRPTRAPLPPLEGPRRTEMDESVRSRMAS
ncbi:MAG: sigma-54 dependent transcriptional regulator [Anaerolineaceae bacterium]